MSPRLCEHCGYDLAGLGALPGPVTCPECGSAAEGTARIRPNPCEKRVAVGMTVGMCVLFLISAPFIGWPGSEFIALAGVGAIVGPVFAGCLFWRRLRSAESRARPVIRLVAAGLFLNALITAGMVAVYYYVISLVTGRYP